MFNSPFGLRENNENPLSNDAFDTEFYQSASQSQPSLIAQPVYRAIALDTDDQFYGSSAQEHAGRQKYLHQDQPQDNFWTNAPVQETFSKGFGGSSNLATGNKDLYSSFSVPFVELPVLELESTISDYANIPDDRFAFSSPAPVPSFIEKNSHFLTHQAPVQVARTILANVTGEQFSSTIKSLNLSVFKIKGEVAETDTQSGFSWVIQIFKKEEGGYVVEFQRRNGNNPALSLSSSLFFLFLLAKLRFPNIHFSSSILLPSFHRCLGDAFAFHAFYGKMQNIIKQSIAAC